MYIPIYIIQVRYVCNVGGIGGGSEWQNIWRKNEEILAKINYHQRKLDITGDMQVQNADITCHMSKTLQVVLTVVA